MSAIIRPPVRPRPKGFGSKPNNYYTLHSAENNAFTLRLNEDDRTSMVGFKFKNDAKFIAQMIETYYVNTQEWPETYGDLILPKPVDRNVDLTYLYIHRWDFEDLKIVCTRNMLDLISVDGIVDTKNGHSFTGNLFKFDAPAQFYQDRFEELMPSEREPDP
jgi:hypothetical protein